MGALDGIATIPQIFGGILAGFIALFGVRVTYPIANSILGQMWTSPIMHTIAILIMWLIYFVVVWMFVWIKFLQKNPGEVNSNG